MLTFIAALIAAVAGSVATYILAMHMHREEERADVAHDQAAVVELVLRELVNAVRTIPGVHAMRLPPGW